MDPTAGSNSSATTSKSNSTELMIALSQIQQLIPLLDYRPGGLTHLLPTLLTPLLPTNETSSGEVMQRYRANLDHAFRVSSELVARLSDGSSVGTALNLAERLMQEGDEKARILRVRKKRRLFVEQEKVLEVNSWGPPVPPRTHAARTAKDGTEGKERHDAAKRGKAEVSAFLPSQNPDNIISSSAQQYLEPPKTPQAVQKYLSALHSYLKTAAERGLLPAGVALKRIRARVASFTETEFTLELQVAQVMKAVIDATPSFADDNADAEDAEATGELQSVDLAGVTLGGVNENIVSATACFHLHHLNVL
uniref:Uncharacterized protein n=1 Tax=Melanopsichium pennsylvanicum 4 TaxID=1398559 RepID=A0A077R3I4_9BASI|nr:putative protein [Melanopsichium pennsylvanicum 4]